MTKREIGSIGSENDKAVLYEAAQSYPTSESQEKVAHTYILASNADEAVEVANAWGKRNSSTERVDVRYVATLEHYFNFTSRGSPLILVGPSLEVDKKVRDKINLEEL